MGVIKRTYLGGARGQGRYVIPTVMDERENTIDLIDDAAERLADEVDLHSEGEL